ncbi:MAG: inositol monophosphatase family protein [Wenzhouxiangella sp.]|jgi:histidinol-phosphatase|nr:inositol monophosphatase family protein [Wenzhouxiangella sp.]
MLESLSPNSDLTLALATARAAAVEADRIAMAYFRSEGLAVERKSDESPVTIADRECEAAIRKVLQNTFPDHAFYGEEYGREGESNCLWLIDPIDGTRSFIRGLPFWSVQIALMIDGELVLGVSSAPAFGETAWAIQGGSAFVGDRVVQARQTEEIEQADVSFGNLRSLARGSGWSMAGELVARAARCRGYGDFYSYHRLADGGQDAVLESDVNILDIAALTVICRQAGARVTDLEGQPIGLETTSILAAAPVLHAKLLDMFSEP